MYGTHDLCIYLGPLLDNYRKKLKKICSSEKRKFFLKYIFVALDLVLVSNVNQEVTLRCNLAATASGCTQVYDRWLNTVDAVESTQGIRKIINDARF